MPRPEKPIEVDGPVAAFAVELRMLRQAAGNPTYRALGYLTNYSPTTLSQAASGRRLPPWEVVQAYVRACQGNEEEWHARWQEARAATKKTASTPPQEQAPVLRVPISEGSRLQPRWSSYEDLASRGLKVRPMSRSSRDAPIHVFMSRSTTRPEDMWEPVDKESRRAEPTSPDPRDALTIAHLADLLDELRRRAGLTWRGLADRSRNSSNAQLLAPSTLHDALVARRSPTLAMTLQIVEMCGAEKDLPLWYESWDRLHQYDERARAALEVLQGQAQTPITSPPVVINTSPRLSLFVIMCLTSLTAGISLISQVSATSETLWMILTATAFVLMATVTGVTAMKMLTASRRAQRPPLRSGVFRRLSGGPHDDPGAGAGAGDGV